MSQGNAKPALVIVPYVMGAKTLALFLGIGERTTGPIISSAVYTDLHV
jgi:hypothetical protein